MKSVLKYVYVIIICILIIVVFSIVLGIDTTDKIHNPYGRKIYCFHDHRL